MGHLALSVARARTSLTRLKVQKAVAPSILENLEKMCTKKKKKKEVGKTSAELFGTPLERGIPMKRVPIYWVLILDHRSHTVHCRQYNALHTLSFKSVTALI